MFNKAKKVLTKLLAFSFVACCTVGLTMGLTGCGDEPSDSSGNNTPVAVSVKSIEKQEDGSLLITFTDGKTQKIELSNNSQPAACTHENVEKVRILGSFEGMAGGVEDPEEFEEMLEALGVTWTHHDCSFLEICKDCGVTSLITDDESAHVIMKQEATCTAASKEVCVWCGYEVANENADPALDHELSTKYAVGENKTICEDGGFAITYCTREDCDYVDEDSIEKVAPMGHHSTAWKVETEPKVGKVGALTGICNGCDLVVNDEAYTGCGNEVTYELPALDAVDEDGNAYYVKSNETQKDCSKEGTATYAITVDGKEFKFNAKIPAKNHSIATTEGNKQIATNAEIDADDATYAGSWTLLAGQEVKCDNEAGATAIFYCTECETPVSIKITKKHTRPEEGITFVPANNDANAVDTLQYNCKVCEQAVEEKIGHAYEYDMIESGDKFFLKTTCAHKFGNVECTYEFTDITPLEGVVKTIDEDPTCVKEGKGHYTYVKEDETLTLNFTIAKIAHKFEGNEHFAMDKVNVSANPNIKPVDTGVSVPTCSGGTVLGVFTCESCAQPVGVNLYTAHTKPAEYTKPTCTTDGAYTCTVCKNTVDASMDESLNALDHDYEYAYVSGLDVNAAVYVINYSCKRADCDFEEVKNIEKSKCDELITVKPTCENEGTLVITVYTTVEKEVVDYQVTAVLAKTPHILTINGVATEIVNGKIYDFNASNMKLIDTGSGVPACNAETGAQAIFTCEYCEYSACGIQVKLPHEKPTDASKITTVAPTCTTKGYDEWFCTVCQSNAVEDEKLGKDNEKDALGHVWAYGELTAPTNNATGTLVINCTFEGDCALKEGVTITLPKLNATLADSETLYYEVEEIAAECEQVAGLKYTISAAQVAELLNAELDNYTVEAADCKPVSFMVGGQYVNHEQGQRLEWTNVETVVGDGEKSVSFYSEVNEAWVTVTLLEGVSYEITTEYVGYVCNECGKIIISYSRVIAVTTVMVEMQPAA